MRFRTFLITVAAWISLLQGQACDAWGPAGHEYIGQAALVQLDPKARGQVRQILSATDVWQSQEMMFQACIWPDGIRKTPGWEWSAPLHYVNLPRSSYRYVRQRDCADGICVTEGIKKYVQRLTVSDLEPRQRWEALAWVCHLVADLHQPLHAGFRDDRGGNRIDVRFQGRTVNLHRFWDSELVRAESREIRHWPAPDARAQPLHTVSSWNPASVDRWTEESHRIAADLAYPPGEVIEADFARQSLRITQEQWEKAAARLALILNAVLGEGEVVIAE